MVRPKIFLDTNICINAAKNGDEWRRVWKYINRHFRYQISFITMKELFIKAARGADDSFDKNRHSLKILYGTTNRRFLPYPSVFALRTVLGLQSVNRESDTHDMTDEVWAETVLKLVLATPTKAQLKTTGIPSRNMKGRKHFFDLDHFDTLEDTPQKESTIRFEGIREGELHMPKPITWAAAIIEDHDLTPYTDQSAKLASALDSAYKFNHSLSQMTKDKGYSFQVHASDWGDLLQLFYLCDESMHFLTGDKDFLHRTRGSAQASRILLYPEFVGSIPDAF